MLLLSYLIFFICLFAHGSCQRQELNGRCLHVSDCNRVGYFCSSNRTCQCGVGYIPNRDYTKCLGLVGSRCAYDKHCIDGAYCTVRQQVETCQCRELDDFWPSDDHLWCISGDGEKTTWPLHGLLLTAVISSMIIT